LDPAGTSTAAITRRGPQPGEDLFDAPTYSDWARVTMRVRPPAGDALVLFDSTIREPTEELIEVVRDAFSTRITNRYVSAFDGGNPFAVEALCRRYDIEADRMIATTGATSAISLVLRTLAQPGDHVLVEQPGFDLLTLMAKGAGLKVGEVPRRAPDFRVDIDELKNRLTPLTRLVLITNLHNPSGAVLTPQNVQEIAAAAGEAGALVVVDEVYGDFARDIFPTPAASLAPNIVTVSSLTKVFGLFALKCGWLIADPAVVQRIKDGAPEGDLGVSKLAHAVAAHVLEEPEVFEAHWRRILSLTRPILRRHAGRMVEAGLIEGDVPSHGCMYFPRVTGADDTRELARRLWSDFGLLVAPGEYFGAPGHIRIGFSTDDPDFERGLERLGAALEAIRRQR
jgi:aspartate/methionine/tyrosine aminotransferase